MKVQFIGPITALHGSISKSSEFYYKVQNGKTILARKPQRTAKSKAAVSSPEALTRQQRFAQLNRMAAEVMQTQTMRVQYEQRFRQQKQYATLRGYIVHCLSESF